MISRKFLFSIGGAGVLCAALATALAVQAQPPTTAPKAAAPAAKAATPAPAPFASTTMSFDVKDASGKVLGNGRVLQGNDGQVPGVVLHLELTGLAPGWHGMHFHNKGDCSAADFTSAGPHISMATPVIHGFLMDKANDFGDLPNIYADASGSVKVEVFSPFVTVYPRAGDARPGLYDADGSALVIHANLDDYHTQPIGGAGPRIACGVMKR